MKLFYAPAACSLSAHIALREAGAHFTLEKVDLQTKKTEANADFMDVNPKGYVPALQLESGEVLTEGTMIVQYIADLFPKSQLAPAAGTAGRWPGKLPAPMRAGDPVTITAITNCTEEI